MPLALSLSGTLDGDDASVLNRAEAFWRSGSGLEPAPTVVREGPGLLVALHPAAEPLSLRAAEGQVTVEARTGTAGPGLHRFVTDALLRWSEAAGVTWSDASAAALAPVGREATERTVLDWLADVAGQLLDEPPGGPVSLLLPATHAFDIDGVVGTPLGPRDQDWLRRVAADPMVGADIFPWWGDAQDASYWRGRALAELWTDVRFRPPVSDEERECLERVVEGLERAHGLDPDAPMLWANLTELYDYLGEDSLRSTRTRLKAAGRVPAPIGYRRRPVVVFLSGGWSLRIDGELAERWDERGTWVAWDESRSIFFTSLRREPGPLELPPFTAGTLENLPDLPEAEEGESFRLRRGTLSGTAVIQRGESEGRAVERLDAHAAVNLQAAVGTLVFAHPEDRSWAMETWGTLDHPEVEDEGIIEDSSLRSRSARRGDAGVSSRRDGRNRGEEDR